MRKGLFIGRRLVTAFFFLAANAPDVSAQSAGSSSGTEGALMVTSVLTLVLIAMLFLALIMPARDRQALTGAVRHLRRYLLPGVSDKVLEMDHEFDGIRELDNRIPPWFSTLFLGTIVFGVAYLVDYHVLGSSPLMADEYRNEIASADLQRRIRIASEGSIDENALVVLTDPEALNRGKSEFKKYCVSCHGSDGQGNVGPNLTDDYWIHGGGIKNVYTTIKQGVPVKGMISWQLVFTPKQIQEIASYVLSLHGTNPQNAKKPEGQLFVEPGSAGVQRPVQAQGSPETKPL
jgi:cytochrome c oxidase cbb3-type subunit 3